MGYETRIKLKGELDKEFKSWMSTEVNEGDIQSAKDILIVTCMLCGCEQNSTDMSLPDKIYKNITFRVRYYVNILTQSKKKHLEKELEENDNTVTLCGMSFSPGNESCIWDEDKLPQYFISQLFMLAAFATPGPFDRNNEAYMQKLEEVTDIIDEIESSVYDMIDYQFVKRYRGSEDAVELGDDDDEDNEDGEKA